MKKRTRGVLAEKVRAGVPFALVTLLAACQGGRSASLGALPAAPAPLARPAARAAALPGHKVCGEAAHYVVYAVPFGRHTVIQIVQLQETASFERAIPHARRLAGAKIVYPDGSFQRTGKHGEFDAAASRYAAAHPESLTGRDVAIVVEPPPGTRVRRWKTTLFVPSAAEEKRICVDVIPPNARPTAPQRPAALAPNGYQWSCDPKDYLLGHFGPYPGHYIWRWLTPTINPHWYQEHFYTCGTDQPSQDVEWSRIEEFSNGVGHRVWRVTFTLKHGFQTPIALWLSPDNYFFAHNVHVVLIKYVPPW